MREWVREWVRWVRDWASEWVRERASECAWDGDGSVWGTFSCGTCTEYGVRIVPFSAVGRSVRGGFFGGGGGTGGGGGVVHAAKDGWPQFFSPCQ